MIDLTPALTSWLDAPVWSIAYSGGLDSTVLLHLLARFARDHAAPPLRALHVHHGLQAAGDAWPAHCQRQCDALGVELVVIQVQVASSASLEQAAREARYAALAQVMEAGEVLFTGQHRDDQAETLLFRLLRGAGLRGLTGIPAVRSLGPGHLVRPLLPVPREQLLRHAHEHGMQWIEDPSNTDTEFARNFLRHAVLPMMRQRWPQAERSLTRTVAHLNEAQGLLDELAISDLAAARAGWAMTWLGLESLDLASLLRLSPARQRNALQYWLACRTRLPDTRHWVGWENLRDAVDDAQPLWRLTDGLLQRSQGRIWWLSGEWLTAPVGEQAWEQPGQPLALPGNGHVRIGGDMPQGALYIRYRRGGEVLDIPGRGRRDLKRLLNELEVPHFVRSRLPLLYREDCLLAVANLPNLGKDDCRLHWQPPTSAQGLS
ncbi:tRNA lysidine(34) synthetase TilS [Pseudomonas capeferrum]|uniref:tRNA lysidine(34) synthetase TilS n=1 Tax=Pseudomonas capeferrum TaxID=1495066 RepID=UPI0015E41C87|nr:tRNA lysidine(34) synthetase TilS [Pseudomonas capeferrum]MBA1201346.1 tRNA lysidine(34) synthetase TilS [Pseudomonas capeferrum]